MFDALLGPTASGPAIDPATLPAKPRWLEPVVDLQYAFSIGARSVGPVPPKRRGSRFEGTVAQAEGRRFERKALAAITERLPSLLREPGFRFRDRRGDRSCFPDALARLPDRTLIFEVKHHGHQVGDAWWQLERYYRPVVEAVYPFDPVQTVIVVRRVDPFFRLPARPPVILDARPEDFPDPREVPLVLLEPIV